MASHDTEQLQANFTNALRDLNEKVGEGGTPCTRYIIQAFRDDSVREHFLKHIFDDEMFIGARCLDEPGIPEEARILFGFQCVSPKICLLQPRFLVRLNVISGEVVDIQDPFITPEDPRFAATSTSAPRPQDASWW